MIIAVIGGAFKFPISGDTVLSAKPITRSLVKTTQGRVSRDHTKGFRVYGVGSPTSQRTIKTASLEWTTNQIQSQTRLSNRINTT